MPAKDSLQVICAEGEGQKVEMNYPAASYGVAYVAVTRARERLFIPYCSGNELISRLLKST